MNEITVADAARSNAAWCDAVCLAHGSPGAFSAACWLTRGPAPPCYPNLVTLEPALEPALSAVRELDRARPAPSFGVKDSFAVLPLAPLGFRILFEAEWIVRPPLPAPAGRGAPGGRWRQVRSEAELSAWEAAWGESAGRGRVFLPPLLRRGDVAILSALAGGGAVVAGVVAHRAGKAVGLTNFFARGEEAEDGALRAEAVEAAAAAFPGLPLVAWEAGRGVAESRAHGFAPIGPLRVWVRVPPPGRAPLSGAARPRS